MMHDLEKLRLTAVDVEDRAEWRRKTRVADLTPHQTDLQPKGVRELIETYS